MSDIEHRRATRLRVMDAIYRETGDDPSVTVTLPHLREELGLSDDNMANALHWLEGEELITWHKHGIGTRTRMHASITHLGVKAMEQSELRPDSATELFPARGTVIVHLHDSPSTLQINSPGAVQNVDGHRP